MPKINIGDETVKVIRHGSDLVKEVYSGSDLIYRAFHNFVEGCNGNTLLPAQGNGSRLIIPEHPGDPPSGEYFHYYNFGGNKVRPGNVIIYPENPSIATLQNLGFDNQETPYYYPDHFVAYYSSSPGDDPDTPIEPEPVPGTCIVNIVGFDVNMDGVRKTITCYKFTEGVQGSSFSYTLGSIWSQGGFTNAPSGLTITSYYVSSSNADKFPVWSRSSSTTGGLAESTASRYWTSGSASNTGTIGQVYEWRKVYKYGSTYFI